MFKMRLLPSNATICLGGYSTLFKHICKQIHNGNNPAVQKQRLAARIYLIFIAFLELELLP